MSQPFSDSFNGTPDTFVGEKLSASSAEDAASLHRGILYGSVASAGLWAVIILLFAWPF